MTYGYGQSEIIKIELPAEGLNPYILDDFTLAFFLGIRNKTLWHLIKNKKKLYKIFKIPKKDGNFRVIHAPLPMMKYVLQQAHTRLLTPLQEDLGPHVTAYRNSKSIVDAVKLHVPKCAICDNTPKGVTPKRHECPRYGAYIHMDLKNFFGSTKRSWIRNYFMSKGYSFYVSGLIANLLTVDDIPRTIKETKKNKNVKQFSTGTPQGSPASGAICNLIADQRIDQAIIKLLKEFDGIHGLKDDYCWRYSRYADDLTLTCGLNLPLPEKTTVVHEVSRLIHLGGYAVNEKKTRLTNSYYRKTLLGIVFNTKPNIPKEEYLRIRAIVHNCLTQGLETQVEKAKRKDVDDLISFLRGKIAYFHQVNPEKAEKLSEPLGIAINQYAEKKSAEV